MSWRCPGILLWHLLLSLIFIVLTRPLLLSEVLLGHDAMANQNSISGQWVFNDPMENLLEQEREQRYTRLNRKTTQTEATLLFNEEEIDEERIEMIAVQLNSDSNLTVSFLSRNYFKSLYIFSFFRVVLQWKNERSPHWLLSSINGE